MDKVAAITEVQRATEAAMAAVGEYLESDQTPTAERAHEIIDEVLAAHGCESPKQHIVAGGTQSAEPHEEGKGPLQPCHPIVIDIYPRSKNTGYFADMTRTVCIGEPSAKLQQMYETVLAAQQLAIAMVAPDVSCIDIQNAVEQHFKRAGYETRGAGTEFPFAEGFVHGVGHGVSKELHDKPRIGRNSKDILQVGDVVTIEPGLYYKNIGGVRIEDLILVTEDGPKNLTRFPKSLII